MKLSHKLPIAFAVVSLLIVFAGLFGFYQLNQTIDSYTRVIEVDVKSELNVNAMLVDFKTQVQEWKNALLRGKDPEQLDKYWASFQKQEQQVAAAAKALQAALPAGEARSAIERFAQAHGKMGEDYRKGFEAFKSSGFDPGAGDHAVKGMDRAPSELLNTALKEIDALSHASVKLADENSKKAILISMVLMMAGFASALICGILISRSITRHLNEVVAVAKTVAAGDLNNTIVVTTKDENGEMLQALKDMSDSLARTVAKVRSASETISTASTQIAAGNLDLSSRTEEQASALQQTASSMEEQTASLKRSAENARLANQLANSASTIAAEGGEVVAKVVAKMGTIDQSAQKIANIISVIDGIAFQTNILALNAAVEAARAGEQGRGFAVVASEVRTLAQRSASAAKEIKTLIDDSVQNVNEGSQLVSEAGVTMRQVVESIKRVTDIMQEITEAATEQSQGIEHVNEAISQMDQVTQQNAALVEEAAAAAASLKDQAAQLVQAIGVFKVDLGTASLSPVPAIRQHTARPMETTMKTFATNKVNRLERKEPRELVAPKSGKDSDDRGQF